MSLAYRRTESGLVFPESGVDEAAIRRALRDHDDQLRLIPPGVDMAGRPQPERVGYRVARLTGGDRPLEFLCFWGNDMGDPYPLSHAIVDMVKQLDRNTGSAYMDDVVRNELARQVKEKDWARDTEALADDWAFKHGRPVLPRGQSLRRARDKRRARGENV